MSPTLGLYFGLPLHRLRTQARNVSNDDLVRELEEGEFMPKHCVWLLVTVWSCPGIKLKSEIPMKVLSLLLVTLLVCNGAVFADQAAPAPGTPREQSQETVQAAKVRTKVQKRGIGGKSLVKAKLVNGAEVKGYISKIEEASFTVTDKRTSQTTTIPYAEVRKIQGPGLSRGSKILIAVTVVGVLSAIAIGVTLSHTRG